MTRSALISVVVALAASPMVASAGASYDYADAAYVHASRSGQDSMSGFGVAGMFSFRSNLHLAVVHSSIDNNVRDTSGTLLAVGYSMPLSRNTDLVARVGWAWERNRFNVGPTANEDGVAVGVGIRSMLTDSLEFTGMVNYADTVRARTALGIEGVYYFTDSLALVFGADVGDRTRLFRLGMRFAFDDF